MVLSRLRKLFTRKKHRHSKDCTTETCLERADEKLHEQASRLHVLEWEAYGRAKPKPKGHH